MKKEEALEQICKWDFLNEEEKEVLETLIPELRELREFYERQQEDKRIRKELVEAFEALDINSSWNGIPVKSILAWLEDQKPAELSQDEFTENIRRLITNKLTVTTKGSDGSTLSSTVFIDDKTAKDIANGILFYVGKEALKNPDREIPEWSEEDEERLKAICTYLQDYPRLAKLGDKLRFNKYCDFLKSLKPQKQDNNISISPERLKELRDKSFEDGRKAGIVEMAKSMWKPSEEQMGALQVAAMVSQTDFETLTSLLVDLMKLKEDKK